jgi:hypothetical protein
MPLLTTHHLNEATGSAVDLGRCDQNDLVEA